MTAVVNGLEGSEWRWYSLILSAKGERRVSRDLLAKSETMEDKEIGVRKLRECLC
jgi:hypothetical protein